MPLEGDEQRLDDPEAMSALDPSGMLRAVATSAAQLREAVAASAGLADAIAEGRPRSLVVCGMGGSGIAADLLGAVVGARAPIPVVAHRDYGLPGWVGAADLVVVVSCSGRTAETLAAADEARRRSARLVGIGAPDSPLEELVRTARGHHVPARTTLAPRASLWSLATPLFVLAAGLGCLDLGEPADDGVATALEESAARLERVALACAPDRESFVNPGKELALALAAGTPLLWGSGVAGPVAARRAACQLAENAKAPAVHGGLPEVLHNQVVTLDGETGSEGDFFRDRMGDGQLALQLVLLRDDHGDDRAAAGAEAAEQVATGRGLRVTVVRSEGDGPVERIASLIGLVDFASVYLALLRGLDPTPIRAIDELKGLLAEPAT